MWERRKADCSCSNVYCPGKGHKGAVAVWWLHGRSCLLETLVGSPPALVGADVWQLFHLTQTAGHDPGKGKGPEVSQCELPQIIQQLPGDLSPFFFFSSHPLPGLIHHTGGAMPVCHGTFQRDQCLPPAQPRSQTRSSLLHPSTGDADWRSNAKHGQK